MNKFKSFLFIAIGLLLFSACGPKSETIVTLQTEASAVGPFFAGPNSLIAEYKVDLSSIKGLENVSQEQIKEIKVNSVKVVLNESDEVTFDSFTSASLQMVGSTTEMKTIAIKNPIDSETRELTLEVSEEADVVDYFKNDKFSVVLDLDFVEDSYADEFGAIVELELTVKHN